MNKQELREIYYFPNKLDAEVNERFGAETECQTILNIFGDMGHKTVFRAKGQKKKDIETFIAGYMAGNLELRERIAALKK